MVRATRAAKSLAANDARTTASPKRSRRGRRGSPAKNQRRLSFDGLPPELDDLDISLELREKLAASREAQQIVIGELASLSEEDKRQRARDAKRAHAEERSCEHESRAPTPDEITVERALFRANEWSEVTARLRAGLPMRPDDVEIPTSDLPGLLN
jgi:hypothetical protein